MTLLLLVGADFALWRGGVLALPFMPPPQTASAPTQDLFALAKTNDVAAVTTKLAAGADLGARDKYGQTPLMYAASEGAGTSVLDALLKGGADVNAQTDAGWTPLMYAARDAADLSVPLHLMNAAADPTLRNADGQSAADLARGNSAMSSELYNRLQELSDGPFDPAWPSAFVVPVEGATISSRANHLPGAPRAYRNGTHEGFDFYGGSVSVPISYGTPINVVADGVVVRADHDYVENSIDQYNEIIDAAKRSLNTPPDILDKLRGRQVWVEHAGGFVTRYAHLSSIPDGVAVGNAVKQGEVVGATGNSGTLEAAQNTEDDPHPHVEIWKEDVYLGKGLEPQAIYKLAAQAFGKKAMPPYTGE
ncbi:hypothetical protein BH24DEI2_BH24DEI2_15950 [soil metagenome]